MFHTSLLDRAPTVALLALPRRVKEFHREFGPNVSQTTKERSFEQIQRGNGRDTLNLEATGPRANLTHMDKNQFGFELTRGGVTASSRSLRAKDRIAASFLTAKGPTSNPSIL